ncbi:MAG: OmpH family outer membrane protein [Acidobacteriota bacterium]
MRSSAVNKLLKHIAPAMAVCLVAMLAGVLMAQSGQIPTKIGVINLQQAVPNTQEAKAATARLQREFVEPRTKALTAKQDEIRDLQEKLQRGGNTLSQTAKDDQQLAINRKTKDFNREVEDYQADSDEHQRNLLGDFSTKMQSVISAYAAKNNFAAIFDSGNRDTSGLIWSADGVDVTQAIIEAYDLAHPATVPAAAAPATGAAKQAAPPVAPKQIPPAPGAAKSPAGK